MCFSLRVSVFSFVLSVCLSTHIFLTAKTNIKEKKALSLFFIFVSLMQVVEALIWAAIRYRSETLNKVATVLGFWLNLLQPLVLLLLCVAFQIQSSVSVRFLIIVGAAYFVF